MAYLKHLTTQVFAQKLRDAGSYLSKSIYYHLARHSMACEIVVDARSLTDGATLYIKTFDGPDSERWAQVGSSTPITSTASLTRITVDIPFGPFLVFQAVVAPSKTADFSAYAIWYLFEKPAYLEVEDIRGMGMLPGVGVEGVMRDVSNLRNGWLSEFFIL